MRIHEKEIFMTVFKRKVVLGYLVVGLIGCFIGLLGLFATGIYVFYIYNFTSNWVYRVLFISLPFPFLTYIVSNGFHLAFEAFSRLLRAKEIIDIIKGEG